jgi:hypothetical protein
MIMPCGTKQVNEQVRLALALLLTASSAGFLIPFHIMAEDAALDSG